jgi:hypothetical protein
MLFFFIEQFHKGLGGYSLLYSIWLESNTQRYSIIEASLLYIVSWPKNEVSYQYIFCTNVVVQNLYLSKMWKHLFSVVWVLVVRPKVLFRFSMNFNPTYARLYLLQKIVCNFCFSKTIFAKNYNLGFCKVFEWHIWPYVGKKRFRYFFLSFSSIWF